MNMMRKKVDAGETFLDWQNLARVSCPAVFLPFSITEIRINAMRNIVQGAVCVGLVLGLLVSGCGRGRETVTLAGSTAFQSFAEKLADHYMVSHPGVSIMVQGGGSALGVQAALSGAAQIGMADLVNLPAEASSLKSVVVARDGIAMVVHPSNPITGLTTEQIRGVFNGTIRNWKEVGGEERGISVVSREEGSGTRTSFEQIVKQVKLLNDAIIQDSNGTIRETVANDAGAIGYLSHGLLNEKIKAVSVDGVVCSESGMMSGGYPLVRPIFLLAKPEMSPACSAFLEFMQGEEAQEMIHKNGLIRAKAEGK
jgi:phosphate transport system substrate-binding protein